MFNGKCPRCQECNLVVHTGDHVPYVSCEFLQCRPRIDYRYLPDNLLKTYYDEKRKKHNGEVRQADS